jgi:hypothetical protein
MIRRPMAPHRRQCAWLPAYPSVSSSVRRVCVFSTPSTSTALGAAPPRPGVSTSPASTAAAPGWTATPLLGPFRPRRSKRRCCPWTALVRLGRMGLGPVSTALRGLRSAPV